MSQALREMRVDNDQVGQRGGEMIWRGKNSFSKLLLLLQNFTVKNPTNSNSALAKKRRAKAAGGIPSTIKEQMSTE